MPSAIVGGVCLKGEKSMCKEIQIDSFQEVAVRLVRMPASQCQDPAVDSPGKAALFMASLLGGCTVENMAVVMTDTRLKPLCYSVVSRGSIDMACYSPAEILRVAILSNAAGVLCFHNHPSGNPSPSKEDDAVASNLSDALRLFRIPLYDFIIIGGSELFSYREQGRGPYRQDPSTCKARIAETV